MSGAQGTPSAAFGQEGPAVALPCSAFPRVDAYLYSPVVYSETTSVVSTVASTKPFPGDCPTTVVMESGWAHLTLGSPAA